MAYYFYFVLGFGSSSTSLIIQGHCQSMYFTQLLSQCVLSALSPARYFYWLWGIVQAIFQQALGYTRNGLASHPESGWSLVANLLVGSVMCSFMIPLVSNGIPRCLCGIVTEPDVLQHHSVICAKTQNLPKLSLVPVSREWRAN